MMMSGPTSGRTRSRTTSCTTRASPALVAPPARAPSSPARISAPGAGGGRTRSSRSADCTSRPRAALQFIVNRSRGFPASVPAWKGRANHIWIGHLMTLGETNPAHGGRLIDLLAGGEDATVLREQTATMPVVTLNSRSLSDLELLAVGGYSPLEGFMTQADYRSVVDDMHLASGLPWPMPITLSVAEEDAQGVSEGGDIALAGEGGRILASMRVREKFGYDKQAEAEKVYRTDDEKHPGVAAVYAQGDVLLGGPVRVLDVPGHDDFPDHRLTPAQTRAAFVDRGWRTIVGFQTRNPVHRAHEYITKSAMEIVDGLLLHPLVGDTKSDDIPAGVRMRCYEVLMANYYPADRVILSVNPAAMRYAGPREAIFHALVRKNFGCTHFIVGRDHAGVAHRGRVHREDHAVGRVV